MTPMSMKDKKGLQMVCSQSNMKIIYLLIQVFVYTSFEQVEIAFSKECLYKIWLKYCASSLVCYYERTWPLI